MPSESVNEGRTGCERRTRRAVAGASRDAFHLAVGIGGGLLVIAGIGGLALRPQRRTTVAAEECAGGQLAGQPRLVVEDLAADGRAPVRPS